MKRAKDLYRRVRRALGEELWPDGKIKYARGAWGGDRSERRQRFDVAKAAVGHSLVAGLVLAALTLTGCASIQPSVKAVCSICSSVCPLVALTPVDKALVCPQGQQLVITNWKEVEKGQTLKVECR